MSRESTRKRMLCGRRARARARTVLSENRISPCQLSNIAFGWLSPSLFVCRAHCPANLRRRRRRLMAAIPHSHAFFFHSPARIWRCLMRSLRFSRCKHFLSLTWRISVGGLRAFMCVFVCVGPRWPYTQYT